MPSSIEGGIFFASNGYFVMNDTIGIGEKLGELYDEQYLEIGISSITSAKLMIDNKILSALKSAEKIK